MKKLTKPKKLLRILKEGDVIQFGNELIVRRYKDNKLVKVDDWDVNTESRKNYKKRFEGVLGKNFVVEDITSHGPSYGHAPGDRFSSYDEINARQLNKEGNYNSKGKKISFVIDTREVDHYLNPANITIIEKLEKITKFV